jgi:hypothetical protein
MEHVSPISRGELVTYTSDRGNKIVGIVVKVNRVNSKVQVISLNGMLRQSRPIATVYKSYLRRATENQIDSLMNR